MSRDHISNQIQSLSTASQENRLSLCASVCVYMHKPITYLLELRHHSCSQKCDHMTVHYSVNRMNCISEINSQKWQRIVVFL